MLRWFWWRINAWTEIVAMFSSLLYFLLVEHWFGKETDTGLAAEEVMAIVAGLTIVTWLLTTLLTPAEDEKTLRAFYRKIRPGGPGWKPIAKLESNVLPDNDLGLRIISAILAAGVVYSTLPAVGYVIFGETTKAAICIGAAVLFGGGVLYLLPQITISSGIQPQADKSK